MDPVNPFLSLMFTFARVKAGTSSTSGKERASGVSRYSRSLVVLLFVWWIMELSCDMHQSSWIRSVHPPPREGKSVPASVLGAWSWHC